MPPRTTSALDFILIDASGSMQDKWPQVIPAVNRYANELTRNLVNSRLTAAQFSDLWGFDFKELRSGKAALWKPIVEAETKVSGQTPLNDAIWYSCELIDDQLKLFDSPNEVSVCLAIISDGGENASEHDTESTRDLIAVKRKAGWQIIFLGLDFDVEQIAKDYGCEAATALNTRAEKLAGALRTIATKRRDPKTPLLFDGRDKRDLGA